MPDDEGEDVDEGSREDGVESRAKCLEDGAGGAVDTPVYSDRGDPKEGIVGHDEGEVTGVE